MTSGQNAKQKPSGGCATHVSQAHASLNGMTRRFHRQVGPGTGLDAVAAPARPRREIIVVYEERKRAPPDVYMVSSMIAFTMSPSFARSASTAFEREHDR